MDTKWKNRKKTISFLIFFLGISITLGSIMTLFRDKPSGARFWQVDRILEEDYQQSARFRGYIANRLENLLIMATGGNGLGGIWGYNNGIYYGGGYDGNYYYGDFSNNFYEFFGSNYSYLEPQITDLLEPQPVDVDNPQTAVDTGTPSVPSLMDLNDYLYGLESMLENYAILLKDLEGIDNFDWDTLKSYRLIFEDYFDEIQDYIDSVQDYLDDHNYYPYDRYTEDIKPLTEEQKTKIIQKYHDSIKADKNLLYTVAYEGKVLYSNSDFLPADGSMNAPEGYNFILYFDGEKVRIQKDGKELNVYGDGYYREGNDWYVPGYSNFQLDETTNKAAVCIAAAKTPLIYTEGTYGSGGSTQKDNTLYWMNQSLQARRSVLLSNFVCLGAGILLLFLSFFCRKSRGEAAEGIARFQSKIWIEVKILLLLILYYVLFIKFIIFIRAEYGTDLLHAFNYWMNNNYYLYELNDSSIQFGWKMAVNMSPLFWILLFWSIYLILNDLKHNKKIWRISLTAKLYKTFSARNMHQPLSRKMSRRNLTAFITAVLYGVLLFILSSLLMQPGHSSEENLRKIQLLIILGTVFFLILQYLIVSKNMEVARDVEALSGRISEIRNGNYTENCNTRQSESNTEHSDGNSESLQSHDLDAVMTQLEDIRHGMAYAVDEQMKSERMKVELIANVSHDIKTPLTSIISYVEFLKQEEELPAHVKDYIRILDEKSQRLKNMVQDVFTVSKAASGELPMQMEALDFGKLLRQTMADMEEQIESSPVAFRTDIPETPVMIMADGQRMYRVFQNLFENAIKYSLSGSRVYVTLKTDGRLAVASVKNASQMELEKGKDFAARFARGDQSRTDGGSGLGLSIAQSFTEACGGEFSWETDADLFVVKVSFQILPAREKSNEN